MTDLLYSDVEDALRSAVQTALTRRHTYADAMARFDAPWWGTDDLWADLCTIGVPGLMCSGDEGGPREAAVVLEELGRTVAPSPFLCSSVIATTLLEALPGDEARGLLDSLASGERVGTVVLPWTARRGHWSPAQVGHVVSPVAGAIEADLFLVLEHGDDGPRLRALAKDDVTVVLLSSLDMTRPLASVSWSAGGGGFFGSGERVAESVNTALSAGVGLLASEQLGTAQKCLEMTVEYTKTRAQFDRPVGSFQGVKHRLADLYVDIVQAQAAARYAAISIGGPDEHVAVAVAQSMCSEVAVRAAEEAVQLHGGAGMTWEYPLHLYLKRAMTNQLGMGTSVDHREDLARLVGLDVSIPAVVSEQTSGAAAAPQDQSGLQTHHGSI